MKNSFRDYAIKSYGLDPYSAAEEILGFEKAAGGLWTDDGRILMADFAYPALHGAFGHLRELLVPAKVEDLSRRDCVFCYLDESDVYFMRREAASPLSVLPLNDNIGRPLLISDKGLSVFSRMHISRKMTVDEERAISFRHKAEESDLEKEGVLLSYGVLLSSAGKQVDGLSKSRAIDLEMELRARQVEFNAWKFAPEFFTDRLVGIDLSPDKSFDASN